MPAIECDESLVPIADDHAIVKEGLASLLKEHGFDVVGAVGDGQSLLDASRRLRPDVIVTDLSVASLSGLDVVALLKAERIDSKVVVLTMDNDGRRAAQTLRAGASAFLLKESAGDELVAAIHEAVQGRILSHTGGDTRRHGTNDRSRRRVRADADPAPDRRAAPHRQGAADEGDRGQARAVDAHGRNTQVRHDAGAWPAFDRGTGQVRH